MTVFHKAVSASSAEVLSFLIQKYKHQIDIVDEVSYNMNLIFPKDSVPQKGKSAFSMALEFDKPDMVSRLFFIFYFVIKIIIITSVCNCFQD